MLEGFDSGDCFFQSFGNFTHLQSYEKPQTNDFCLVVIDFLKCLLKIFDGEFVFHEGGGACARFLNEVCTFKGDRRGGCGFTDMVNNEIPGDPI